MVSDNSHISASESEEDKRLKQLILNDLFIEKDVGNLPVKIISSETPDDRVFTTLPSTVLHVRERAVVSDTEQESMPLSYGDYQISSCNKMSFVSDDQLRSVISVTPSTDLEKYMDSSVDTISSTDLMEDSPSPQSVIRICMSDSGSGVTLQQGSQLSTDSTDSQKIVPKQYPNEEQLDCFSDNKISHKHFSDNLHPCEESAVIDGETKSTYMSDREGIAFSGGNSNDVYENKNLMCEKVEKEHKKHIRKSSYTLDKPSSVLIMAHERCSSENSSSQEEFPPQLPATKLQEQLSHNANKKLDDVNNDKHAFPSAEQSVIARSKQTGVEIQCALTKRPKKKEIPYSMDNRKIIDKTVVSSSTSVIKIFNESGDQKEMLPSWNNKNQLENEVVERSESKQNRVSLLVYPRSFVTDNLKTNEKACKTERTEPQNEAVISSSPIVYDGSSRNLSSMVSFTENQIMALEEKSHELKKYLEETSTEASELAKTGVYRKDKKSAVFLQEREQNKNNGNSITELTSCNSPSDCFSRTSNSLSVEELLQEQEYNFAQFRQQLQEQHKHQMEALLHQQIKQRKSLQDKITNQEIQLAQGPGFIKEAEINYQKSLKKGNFSESVKEVPDTENFYDDTSPGSDIIFPVNQPHSLRKQSLIGENDSFALPPKETPVFHVPFDYVSKDLSAHTEVSQVVKDGDKAADVLSKFTQMPSSVIKIPPEALDPAMKLKFDRLTAAAKGFLTRLLMKSDRVQGVIQTIKDTLECALKFHQETPIKKGYVTLQDAELHKRLLTQLTAACYELHRIFFELSTKEKMAIIAQSRKLPRGKRVSTPAEIQLPPEPLRKISSATLKSLERKKGRKQAMSRSMNYSSTDQRAGSSVVIKPRNSPPGLKNSVSTKLQAVDSNEIHSREGVPRRTIRRVRRSLYGKITTESYASQIRTLLPRKEQANWKD
ncbi:centriolar coiled coil protein 110kDa isoform X2 [Tachypleus tridentatus]